MNNHSYLISKRDFSVRCIRTVHSRTELFAAVSNTKIQTGWFIWLIWAICFVFSMQIEVAFLWYIRFLLKLKPEQTLGFELNSSASVSGWFFYGSRWWNRFISPQSKPHLSVFSFIPESRLSRGSDTERTEGPFFSLVSKPFIEIPLTEGTSGASGVPGI